MLLLESYTYQQYRLLLESNSIRNNDITRELKNKFKDMPYSVYSETSTYGLGDEPYTMDVARSDKDMGYIGEPKKAYQLWNEFGIEPECIDDSHNVCSIGWSEKDQKYYGWSHRALCGFSIGDKIYDQKYSDPRGDKTPFVEHGYKDIKTKADARKAAINFANSVA